MKSMKRLWLLLLCFTLIFSMSSCAIKDQIQSRLEDRENEEDSDVEEEDITEEDTEEVDSGDVVTEDTEDTEETEDIDYSSYDDAYNSKLTDFLNGFLETKQKHYDTIDADSNSLDYSMDILSIYFIDITLAEVIFYDTLIFMEGETRVEGKMAFTEIEGYKEVKDDIISFGSTQEITEDNGVNVVGDVVTTTGYLDIKKDYLYVETKTENGGNVTARNVTELKRLDGDVYKMANMSYQQANDTMNSGMFISTDNNTLYIAAVEADPSENFDYPSLKDIGDVSVQELAKGYTPSWVLSVEGNTVKFDK